jgi:N-acetylmuramoyl-L-alanine amidase
VEVHPAASETVIAVFTSGKEHPEVGAFPLHDPPRLVFDIQGGRLGPDLLATCLTEVSSIQQIRLGQFSVDPDVARLVVDLSEEVEPPSFQVNPGEQPGETLIVLSSGGALPLTPPTVSAVEDAVLVRLTGAAHLPRAVAALADPPRVYADLSHAVLEESYREESDAGAVREIRMAQQPAEPERPVARLVVEMREEQAYTVFSDRDDLIIAVGPQPWALPLSEYQAAEQLKGKRIVVDPGHGGEDIGAPAVFGPPPRGPFEKDIVLDIGQRLAKLLAAEGAEVTMTREDDTYITLQERAALANRLRADAFISIHCDSCDNPNTLSGTSVYYDHAHSARFAQLVQGELTAALGTRNKGVRNANFAVIRRTQGPGILVETAYINHEQDRARLIHPNFRERAARAIARGLIEFTNGPSADRDAGA